MTPTPNTMSVIRNVMQGLVVLAIGWLGSTVLRMDNTLAGWKPVLDQVQMASTRSVQREDYDRDKEHDERDKRDIEVKLADINTRLQEVRLQLTRLELWLQERTTPPTTIVVPQPKSP